MDNGVSGLFVTGGAAAQALSTTAARMSGFTTAVVGSDLDGDQSVVPVAASDWVTLRPGRYLVNFSCSAAVASANVEVTYDLRAGSTAVATVPKAVVEASDAGAMTCASFVGVVNVTATANYSVFVVAESGTPNLTPREASLVFTRIN